VGAVKHLFCSGLLFTLVISDQALLNIKSPSVLKLFLFRFISVASFVRRSTVHDFVSNSKVPLKSMQ